MKAHSIEEQSNGVIAEFGGGILVRADGAVRLHGGTADDLIEAKEWVSLFMPEAVIRNPHQDAR